MTPPFEAAAAAEAPRGGVRENFLRRYLDPADRLNEILFGLIMVLTFTLTAGIAVGDGPDAGRALLIATIGCNVAWGLIDGAMYLTACLLERSRGQRRLRALHEAADEATALRVVDAAVEEAIGGDVTAAATAEERAHLLRLVRDMALRIPPGQSRLRREDLLGAVASGLLVILTTLPAALPFLLMDSPWRALRIPPGQSRLRREDLLGAVASGLLVMLTTVPAALPFLLIESPWRALRVSNLLLLGALFAVGYQWGKYSYSNRWGAGLVFLVVGLALVGTAIALGG